MTKDVTVRLVELLDAIDDAIEQGAPPLGGFDFSVLSVAHEEIVRLRLAAEPPADSTPLERAFAKEPERSIVDEALRKIGALEDAPFLPIKPEVLQAFSKQMVDWGVVWVKYGPDGAKVIPHEEIYESPPNR